MKNPHSGALIIAVLTASTSAQEKTVAVKAGRIIDGTGTAATGAVVILIEDGRIKLSGRRWRCLQARR